MVLAAGCAQKAFFQIVSLRRRPDNVCRFWSKYWQLVVFEHDLCPSEGFHFRLPRAVPRDCCVAGVCFAVAALMQAHSRPLPRRRSPLRRRGRPRLLGPAQVPLPCVSVPSSRRNGVAVFFSNYNALPRFQAVKLCGSREATCDTRADWQYEWSSAGAVCAPSS